MHKGHIGISAHIKFCGNHTHTHGEICMNLEGNCINYANDIPHEFSPGDIFVCAPGIVHSKKASSDYFKDIFTGIWNTSFLPDGFTFGYYKDSDGSVRQILEIMHKIYNSDSSERFSTLGYLSDALCNMIKGKMNSSQKITPAVEQLKTDIITNFSNPEYKISDSKEYAYYNKDYLRQLFKKETGLSPLDYLNELRFTNAKKLLETERTPQYKVSEISYLCGFYDVGYFTRMFRKKYGTTPSDYRVEYSKKRNDETDDAAGSCDCTSICDCDCIKTDYM